jgi:hypothetical protein
MIGYALFGSNDLPRSFAIYDALFASVGISRLMEFPTGAVCWGTSWTAPMLGVGGAADEGAPGVRGEEGPQAFYGAYFRDPDGNKLCAFRVGPA